MEFTQDQKAFLKVYNQNKPNKYTEFVYGLYEDREFTKGFAWFLVIMFMAGLSTNIMFLKHLTVLFMLLFIIPLVTFVVAGIVAYIMNQKRVHKIMKILGISAKQYNYYVKIWVKQ